MSPTPLIELQRRLAEAGRIRMGEKTDKGAPKRLGTWRITSPDKSLIEQAAERYGGLAGTWESPTGLQFEVVTATAELPVLVMPGYSFRQGYEYRTSPTLVERRCDGVEMDDGKPCACNTEDFKGEECSLLTRLTVALPELTTMLGWRLETKGDNAARELLGSMDLVQGIAGGRPFVPAKLRIVERRGNVKGQAVRYVVPVIDVQVRYAEVLGGDDSRERAALPTGYTPIERIVHGATLADGLREAETQTLTKPPRVPLAEDDEILDDVGAPPSSVIPSPRDEELAPPPDVGNTIAASTRDKPATKAQKTKLDVLVGRLRDTLATITTEQLYSALAKERNVEVPVMVDLIEGAYDTAGVLHWAPLRDSLTRAEAHGLIDRLERLEASLPKAAA